MAYQVHGFSPIGGTGGPTVQGSDSRPQLQTSTMKQVTDVSSNTDAKVNGGATLKHSAMLIAVAIVAVVALKWKVGG